MKSKFKLSAVFMCTVLAVAAAAPLVFGYNIEALIAGGGLVALSTLLVEKGASVGAIGGRFLQRGEVGESLKKVEAEYKEVKDSLKQVSDQIKAHAEKAEKEIKAHAQLSEETKANVDKLLTEQGELRARLNAAEQLIVKFETGGVTSRPKSLGELVAEADDIQKFANVSIKGSASVMLPQGAVTSDGASAGDLVVPQRVPGIVAPAQRRLTIRDLLIWGRATSNSIDFVRESGFTNNAAPVSENPSAGKPQSDIEFEDATAPVITVAHWIKASKQILSDAPMLASYIDGRLIYGLKLKEEAQLLKGSGTGLNINGIYTQASAYSNPGVAVQKETAIDRLRIALLQVELAEYYGDGIVLSPIDWAMIELTKTADDAYLFATPRGLAAPGLWGRPVVPTQAMDAGDFLVGSFGMGVQGWDREQVTVSVSNQDGDNFIKNMVTILCEERVALTVYRPESFVKGDFDGLPATE